MKRLLASLACALSLAAPTFADTGADATFQGLGGKPGIRKIVATLVPLLLADARIKESFTDIDMDHVALRLEEQFCELSGGACRYQGKDMTEIHDGLNITVAQFNALVEDLQLAMERSGVHPRFQNKLLARLAPMQRAIVTK